MIKACNSFTPHLSVAAVYHCKRRLSLLQNKAKGKKKKIQTRIKKTVIYLPNILFNSNKTDVIKTKKAVTFSSKHKHMTKQRFILF